MSAISSNQERQQQKAQEFINVIQNKQLENSLKLARQKTIKIGVKIYNKKPLTAKQWIEIVDANQKMVNAKTESERTKLLVNSRQIGALYYFGIPELVFDNNYELVSPIIDGCILRSNMGVSSDLDFEELLKRFEKYNDLDDVTVDVNGAIKKKKQQTAVSK